MDLPSLTRWYDYSRARDRCSKTPTRVRAVVHPAVRRQEGARLNRIAHILKMIPYEKCRTRRVQLPKRSTKGAYDDQKPLREVGSS